MKPDSQEIKEFLADLASQSWLGTVRSNWVQFSFHFTDVVNAVSILESGRIRCRADLEAEGSLAVDIACSDIISNTDQSIKDSVRLYFRPRTPTQFNNEGIRPSSELSRRSHCPIPVFFLFDSWEILSRDDSKFSDRNLAIWGSHELLADSAEELKRFNFKNIFHVGAFPSSRHSEIITARNAEIVIPKELDLLALRFICCRSPAEKETLLQMLSPAIREEWGPKIRVQAQLYNRKWVFVESTNLSSSTAIFHFFPDPRVAGPFQAVIKVSGTRNYRFHREAFLANEKVTLNFPDPLRTYTINFYLDEHIAFAGSFDSGIEIPF